MRTLLVVTLESDSGPPLTYAANNREQAAREFRRLRGDRVNPRAAYEQWEQHDRDLHLERCGWRVTGKGAVSFSTSQ